MRIHLSALSALALVAVPVPPVYAAAPLDVEIATERGLQITAPREWLQLLTTLGIENVRIRAAKPGDQPALTNRGTADRPRYHVVGLLSARQQLHLPGGTFGRRDRSRLKNYVKRLTADGAEGVIAPRGRFGLTERQFETVHRDLSRPMTAKTKGRRPEEIIERLRSTLKLQFSIDAAAAAVLRQAEPSVDEVSGLTAGSGLSLILRRYGLALRPEKPLGNEVVLRIVPDEQDEQVATYAEREHPAIANDSWPVGWKPDVRPRELTPELFEFLQAEIEGYSLQEALDAIQPRIKVPFYVDHAVLARHKIDPSQVQVKLPRTRTYYQRVLDRILFQARLHGELRIDEAGTVFYWITQ